MIDVIHRSHPCDVGTEPNRQGYLILGPCPVVPTPVPEVCPPPPPDPSFGVMPCRCVKSGFRIVEIDSGTVTPTPRDLVRLPVRVKILVEL